MDLVARLLVNLGFCRTRFWYLVAPGSGIPRETSRIYFWNLTTTPFPCYFQKCLRLTRSCATTTLGYEVLHDQGCLSLKAGLSVVQSQHNLLAVLDQSVRIRTKSAPKFSVKLVGVSGRRNQGYEHPSAVRREDFPAYVGRRSSLTDEQLEEPCRAK